MGIMYVTKHDGVDLTASHGTYFNPKTKRIGIPKIPKSIKNNRQRARKTFLSDMLTSLVSLAFLISSAVSGLGIAFPPRGKLSRNVAFVYLCHAKYAKGRC